LFGTDTQTIINHHEIFNLPTLREDAAPSAQALEHIIEFATTTWDLILQTKLEVSLALVLKYD